MDERYRQHLDRLVASAARAVAESGLDGGEAEVVFILDVSRSMYPMYKAKMVGELATQLLALSLSFDDDGVIPAYAFGDRCRHLGDLRIDDFVGWVDREVIRTGADFQTACRYAPVIDEVCRYYFPEDWDRPASEQVVGRIFKRKRTVYPTLSAPRAMPVFAIFVTSGDCQDRAATTDLVRRSSRLPIFWQFVGLQPPSGKATRFRFLKKLDRLGNTHVDSCGFFEPPSVWDAASLYTGLLNEFPSYLRQPQVEAMVRPRELGGLMTRGERPTPRPTAASRRDTAIVDAEHIWPQREADDPAKEEPAPRPRVRRPAPGHGGRSRNGGTQAPQPSPRGDETTVCPPYDEAPATPRRAQAAASPRAAFREVDLEEKIAAVAAKLRANSLLREEGTSPRGAARGGNLRDVRERGTEVAGVAPIPPHGVARRPSPVPPGAARAGGNLRGAAAGAGRRDLVQLTRAEAGRPRPSGAARGSNLRGSAERGTVVPAAAEDTIPTTAPAPPPSSRGRGRQGPRPAPGPPAAADRTSIVAPIDDAASGVHLVSGDEEPSSKLARIRARRAQRKGRQR